ncbi:hypothetical protein INQ51_17775 [Maribellus sp. CM-23]|uniref:hypothetical protein n=1 Tax=Maribellus sp. CM-23 TaxID=2781026 RepID=UPI001F3FC715|nr:hypothetical protein [Maribellus sp. CM-23]MCE4566174.1 hypothetical protein [Maribellus sp. CM-23]
MKKQFLILFLFVAALVAGTSQSFGQTTTLPNNSTNPINGISCNDSPLHPMPGVSYTYSLNGYSGPEVVADWTWWATKDSAFISASGLVTTNWLDSVGGVDLLNHSANYGQLNQSDSTVSITWSPGILARTEYEATVNLAGDPPSPTFVVGYARGQNCADNMQVYEINPIPAFVIDIANIDGTGNTMDWDVDTGQCVSPIESATYNSSVDSVIVNYGHDTLYFELAAMNFVNDFIPYLTVNGGSLSGSQTADIGIATTYANATNGTFVTDTTVTSSATAITWNTGERFTASAIDNATGVSLWIRVIINNNEWESLAAQTFSLAADAIDDGGNGIWDMEDDDCNTAGGGTDAIDYIDVADHRIDPRPTITHQTSDPISAEPNNVVDKSSK